MERRALCLMAIGERYQTLLRKMEPRPDGKPGQFARYAARCGAELVVIQEAPDPSMHRNILSQKLLIPSLLTGYDVALFIDLDVAISPHCPDLFHLMPDHAGLAAVLSPRGTEKYRKAWEHIPHIASESVSTYFTSRNFPASEKVVGDINGGLLLFRPALVADIFSHYYWSEHSQGSLEAFEEAPMAYLTQTQGLFHALDERFNTQFLYELQTPESRPLGTIRCSGIYRAINKTLTRNLGMESDCLLRGAFGLFRDRLLKKAFIVHFSGKFSSQLYADFK